MASLNERQYIHIFPLNVSRTLNRERLREAWKQVVASFSILRTSFHFIAEVGKWAQAIHSNLDFKWTAITQDNGDNFQEQLRVLVNSIRVDEKGILNPPFHLFLFQDSTARKERGDLLVLVMHHALYDGLSVSKLVEVAHSFYHGGQPKMDVQFSEILPQILWQESEGASFWLQKLRDYRPVRLAAQHIPTLDGGSSSHLASRTVVLDKAKVYELCGRCVITPQCLGQLALAKIMTVLVQSSDVLFGHVVSGRNVPGAEDVVGPILVCIYFCASLRMVLMNNAEYDTLSRRFRAEEYQCGHAETDSPQ